MKVLKIKDLKAVKKTVLLYAEPGQGKTTVLGNLKGKTLILDIDKGTSVLASKEFEAKDISVVPLEDNLSNLKDVLEELEKKCEYDNVCLDSLSELERKMLTIYGREGKNDGAPEQGHYLRTQYKVIDYCRRFRSIDANIIFTSWETQVEDIAKDGTKTTRAKPMLSGKTSENVCGLCDIVGYLQLSTKEGSEGKRYIRLAKTADFIAKDRIDKREWCEIGDLI